MSPSNLPSDISISPLLSFFFLLKSLVILHYFLGLHVLAKSAGNFCKLQKLLFCYHSKVERLKKLLKSLLKTKTNQYYKHLTESYSLPSLSNFCSFNLWECWFGCADVSW